MKLPAVVSLTILMTGMLAMSPPAQAAGKNRTPQEVACAEEYDMCVDVCTIATPNGDDGDAWVDCVARCAHESRHCTAPTRTVGMSLPAIDLNLSLSSDGGGGGNNSLTGGNAGTDGGGASGGGGFNPGAAASTNNAGASAGSGGGGIIF